MGLVGKILLGIVGLTFALGIAFMIGIAIVLSRLGDPYHEEEQPAWVTETSTGVLVLGPEKPEVQLPFRSTLQDPRSDIEVEWTLIADGVEAIPADRVKVDIDDADGDGALTFRLDDNNDRHVQVRWTAIGREPKSPDRIAAPWLEIDGRPNEPLPSYLTTVERTSDVIEVAIVASSPDVTINIVGTDVGGTIYVLDEAGMRRTSTGITPLSSPSCTPARCEFAVWMTGRYRPAEIHFSGAENATAEVRTHSFEDRTMTFSEQIEVAPTGRTSFDVFTSVETVAPEADLPAPVLDFLSEAWVVPRPATDGVWFGASINHRLSNYAGPDCCPGSPHRFWVENERGGTSRTVDFVVTWREPVGAPSSLDVEVDFRPVE